MDGRFLLDTNIVIALLNGDAGVVFHLEAAAEVFIPAVVLGELYFGAAKSTRAAENVAKIQTFAAQRAIVNCDPSVAREYGRLKWLLKVKGRPIPENDLWIAAMAVYYQLTLVTRDDHFDEIEELSVVDWRAPK